MDQDIQIKSENFGFINSTNVKYNFDPCKNKTVGKSRNISVEYDSAGAAKYVVVVIIWYFLSVASFVAWQIKRRKGSSNGYKAEQLFQAMEDQVKTKQILEELRNPEMRKWAWDIYKNQRCTLVINNEYETQVLANLDRRISQIEKRKQNFIDEYITGNSPSKGLNIVKDEINETNFGQIIIARLRDVNFNLSFTKSKLPLGNRMRRKTMIDETLLKTTSTKSIENTIKRSSMKSSIKKSIKSGLEEQKNISVSFANDRYKQIKELSDFSNLISLKLNNMEKNSKKIQEIKPFNTRSSRNLSDGSIDEDILLSTASIIKKNISASQQNLGNSSVSFY